jgi:hypothetical protein
MTIEPPGRLLLVHMNVTICFLYVLGRDAMDEAEFCLETRLASIDFSSFESYC